MDILFEVFVIMRKEDFLYLELGGRTVRVVFIKNFFLFLSLGSL